MSEEIIRSWKDLKVMEKSHKLVLEIYQTTNNFPDEEKYRLTDQLCRASASVPTNIAEGKGRKTTREYVKFLVIARGSVEEMKYLLLLSKDLKYISETLYVEMINNYDEVGKMLNGLIKSLLNSNN